MRAFFLALLTCAALPAVGRSETIFVEAESFENMGGWSLDTAFTQIVGSPYLLAHGLGQPVADATTKIKVAEAGKYRLWVRTKDWVAHWKAPGTPGRFQLLINGKPVATEFGTQGADWNWHSGGEVELPAGEVSLALHDLTGFDGRCDAILLTSDPKFTLPAPAELAAARRAWLGFETPVDDAGEFDLVVVGGGYAGVATAVSAARQSLNVALVQDRFVLGGNGSSEVRVWAQGGTLRGKYPHLGEIVEEFADHAPDSPAAGTEFLDERKEKLVRREKTASLFFGHFAMKAATDKDGKITSVTALEVRTGRERVFRGKLFCDCTGHGVIGELAGAKYNIEPKGRMGMSNMWYWQNDDTDQAWPETPWALALETTDFPKNPRSRSQIDGKPFMKGEWFWESGFDKDSIKDLELIRDWNLRAVFGAFTALKHGKEKDLHTKSALKWVAFVGGPRESRLLEGDVVLTRNDIVSQREFPDGCVPTTWDIDLHYPKEQFAKKYPDNPFISRAEFGAGVDRKNGYPVPYRCFYSKNVPNLFMAGRCISVNHEALGTVRVMRTCGMMGEVVGKAAYLCTLHNTSPRNVYDSYLPDLIDLFKQPGAMRRDTLSGDLYRDTNSIAVEPYLSKGTDKVTGVPNQPKPAAGTSGVAVKSLAGIVADDTSAKMTGKWAGGTGLSPYIAEGYRYANATEPAEARFELTVAEAGKYEVKLAWVGHENRSTRTSCTIEREGQKPLKLRLNQQESTTEPNGFHSLGLFEFPAGKAAIVISNEGADGFIHADAVQLLKK
ncbi:FAD dependent oxidoreductase [Anatilimnocola aggregata]|uniref:FAD dependent oxidoreductase n=1 Tax=Anatilimnocola aggregata TaxID=2528021 RepID=A0A517YJ56_9BACT|nr:FAD-dependent oxidoreductase [Anatilimnocola aggregata]QDU30245.1 FAD dependent oxidoreductase [Anatilimnocola aggregata]